jgi:hypothetical protein
MSVWEEKVVKVTFGLITRSYQLLAHLWKWQVVYPGWMWCVELAGKRAHPWWETLVVFSSRRDLPTYVEEHNIKHGNSLRKAGYSWKLGEDIRKDA